MLQLPFAQGINMAHLRVEIRIRILNLLNSHPLSDRELPAEYRTGFRGRA
jgi:hypothetical protein